MTHALVKVVRFPVDVLLLTADFLRVTEWHMLRWLTEAFGLFGPRDGPFCLKRLRGEMPDGTACSVCVHVNRYSNRALFALLCPSVCPVAGRYVCGRGSRYRIGFWRYIATACLLMTFWAGTGYAVFRTLI
jgi:hypothetical protein